MISFRHAGETVTLDAGKLWTAQDDAVSYRDTSAENLRAIIADVEKGVPWRSAVGARYAESHPWLHKIVTSPARSLFFRQFPPATGSRILDIGAGWGQIALPLAQERDAVVTALEPTAERIAFIRAAATQEGLAERMHFMQADFLEVEFPPAFDLICCIGVLEWVPKFHAGDPKRVQLEFLRRMRTALRPGGKCYVGIENRLGLKYLMGGRDDHTSQRNISVFDSALATAKHHAATGEALRVFTYSHAEYLDLFRAAGFNQVETHGAFPDYKLPEKILPFDVPAELNQNLLNSLIPPEHDGVEGHRLPHQEEFISHYRSLARMGAAQLFCPSFYFSIQ